MVVFYDKHGCGQSDKDREEFALESELFDLETVTNQLDLEQFNSMMFTSINESGSNEKENCTIPIFLFISEAWNMKNIFLFNQRRLLQ